MTLFFTMLLGHFNWGMRTLRNDYCRACGRLVFLTGLCSPIVIFQIYFSQDYTIFVSDPNSLIFGVGNIISNLGVALVLFFIAEYPINSFIGLYFKPRLSQHPILIKYYIEQRMHANSENIENLKKADNFANLAL
jgi:hypothetical protein